MVNVKENIMEMKNKSELIIRLAYSELLQDNKSLIGEINELYESLIKLEKDTLNLLFRIRVSDDEKYRIINLMEFIKDYGNAAINIIKLNFPDTSIVRTVLTPPDERVFTGVVIDNSSLANKKLGDSKLRSHTNAEIIAVKRKDKWMFQISRDFLVKTDDLLVCVGDERAHEAFKKVIKGKMEII